MVGESVVTPPKKKKFKDRTEFSRYNKQFWVVFSQFDSISFLLDSSDCQKEPKASPCLSIPLGRHNSFGPLGSFIRTYVHTYAHTSFLPVLPALLAQAQAQVKLTAPHHTTHHSSSLPTASGPPPLRIV